MKILLMDDDRRSRESLRDLLEKRHNLSDLELTETLQEAIEAIESTADRAAFDLVLCNYRGTSISMLKLLLQLTDAIPCIVLTDRDAAVSELLLTRRDATLELLRRNKPEELEQLLSQWKLDGFFSSKTTADSEFTRVKASGLDWVRGLRADIYLRLAPNRYCRRFKGSDDVDPAELERYFQHKGLEYFYMRKDELDAVVAKREAELDGLLDDEHAKPAQARELAEANLAIVHDLVSELGFSPKVQELAKKTVAVMLKAIGNSPKLSDILVRLRAREGKYIASHSIMLAEAACAIAQRIGWGSSSTFMKLALAAFIHDLFVADNKLAKVRRLDEIKASSNFTAADVQAYKLHPIKAAEYAQQLQQIPSDVDTIIAQHHEEPDGTGFPRSLHSKQISPLACIFIMAHDLLDYFLDTVPANQRDNMLEYFLIENESRYSQGTFKRIHHALKTGMPFVL